MGDEWRKPVKVAISYQLYVKGDMENEALAIDAEPFDFEFDKQDQDIQDLLIWRSSDWGGGEWTALRIIEKLCEEDIHKLCEEKLMVQRAEGITELNSGVLLKGDHFIKCVSSLRMEEYQKLTYPEFEAYMLRKKK